MTLWGFVRRLLREQPLRFSLAVGALVVVGLLEAVAVGALAPLLDLMGGGTGATGTVGGVIHGAFVFAHLPYTLVSVLLFVLLLIVLQQSVNIVQQKIVWGSIYRFEARLRQRLYGSVFSAGWPFFVSEKTGSLMNALTAEATRASTAYNYLNQMIGAAIIVVVYGALALVISRPMTLLIVIVAGLLAFSLRGRVQRGTKYGLAVTDLNVEVQNEALENISGAKLVKGCAAEKVTVDRFSGLADRLSHQQYKMQMNAAWLKAFYDSASLSVVLVGAYFAVTRFGMEATALPVFLLIFYRVSPRLSNVQLLQNGVLAYLPALDTIDDHTQRAEAMVETSGSRKLKHFSKAIVFEGVGFAYEPGQPVIHDLNLTIACGKTTAIVGPSGAGKTTVIDLVMRLVLPQSGQVAVDGVPLADLDVADWRRRISYVAQDAVMFHTSVRENIEWGRPGASAEEIERAARLAFAHDFVTQLPEGYDTIVGDRGMRLSGGQKQRIALARALVRDPEILILDEATSALDAESETQIQSAIEKLSESITILIVTHRLATVRIADHIYVLDKGRLVEQGTWHSLTQKHGRFYELQLLQDVAQDTVTEGSENV
jgi:ABC-type multidrug transport system fused ATPase/permease subunit